MKLPEGQLKILHKSKKGQASEKGLKTTAIVNVTVTARKRHPKSLFFFLGEGGVISIILG